MIAVDTSALMAIALGEPEGRRCITALAEEPDLVISAGTLAETLIVAARRNVTPQVRQLLDDLGMTIAPVSEAVAERVAQAYQSWGKGFHPAGLNWGDCFAYVTASDCGGRLLFVGDDFARTDLISR
ncbi:type II toxin-antitoxin system VapC family toxin [Caulobacter sp. 602-2]|uniref:Ribonuclease VapC n=1 Tax=Caulobacter sp. 602-2 TaxID=2710887 RepID=A0A6G4QWS0_9CAUL|nr:type II toxin-antitoxin system VapC family toxin [Caulobacter sp. 602-2]